MLEQQLLERELPDLLMMNDGTPCTVQLWRKRREEILEILKKNIYGYSPEPPVKVTGIVQSTDNDAFAGKVIQQLIYIKFGTPNGDFTFPLHIFLPKNVVNAPAFVHISFRSDIPDRYIPVEEILDNGFALAFFDYKDITNDTLDGNFSSGLAEKYFCGRKRKEDDWGRIGMWAYAASRVFDYLLTIDRIDHNHISVIGHSRLGKTALWCAAQDERFFMGISNNSGFGGAAIAKHGTGEKVSDFIEYGSWDWFCENFKKLENKENCMLFDQHFLLAAFAPRCVYVSSAEEDSHADPVSEFLSCYAASKVYKMLGYEGLVTDDKLPSVGTSLHKGEIGYHIRSGTHYLSRYDWNQFIKFIIKT